MILRAAEETAKRHKLVTIGTSFTEVDATGAYPYPDVQDPRSLQAAGSYQARKSESLDPDIFDVTRLAEFPSNSQGSYVSGRSSMPVSTISAYGAGFQ